MSTSRKPIATLVLPTLGGLAAAGAYVFYLVHIAKVFVSDQYGFMVLGLGAVAGLVLGWLLRWTIKD